MSTDDALVAVLADNRHTMPAHFKPRQRGPVRAENLVRGCDQRSCPPSRPAVMITAHVPAVHVPPDHADGLMAAVVQASGSLEDR